MASAGGKLHLRRKRPRYASEGTRTPSARREAFSAAAVAFVVTRQNRCKNKKMKSGPDARPGHLGEAAQDFSFIGISVLMPKRLATRRSRAPTA